MTKMNPVKRAYICGNCHQDNQVVRIGEFLRLLEESGPEHIVEGRFARYLSARGVEVPQDRVSDVLPEDADIAISMGGDGTFLRTARMIGSREVPVLGINTGHLGFLANYTLDEADTLIGMLLSGSGSIERRMMLEVESESIPPDIQPYALNEVAILKDDTSSMISARIMIDGIFLAEYLADGLTVSTPTGSTGYNLSAGGPIIQPTLECLCISPIAPHTLTLRPIVVGGDSEITATAVSRASHYRVSLDGCSFVLPCGESFRMRKAGFSTLVVRRPDDNFPATLRKKLLWGQR